MIASLLVPAIEASGETALTQTIWYLTIGAAWATVIHAIAGSDPQTREDDPPESAMVWTKDSATKPYSRPDWLEDILKAEKSRRKPCGLERFFKSR